jgi:hypothetical protein
MVTVSLPSQAAPARLLCMVHAPPLDKRRGKRLGALAGAA